MKGLRRDTQGIAALEFALVAPIFFLILFAIVETGLAYFANGVLENGMKDVARLIRTGQVQAADMTQAEFRAELCGHVEFLLSCDEDDLLIDVRAFSGFGAASFPPAINPDGTLNDNLDTYEVGTADSVVLVRAFYIWHLFTPIFANYYANLPDQDRLLSSSVAFRNEPF